MKSFNVWVKNLVQKVGMMLMVILVMLPNYLLQVGAQTKSYTHLIQAQGQLNSKIALLVDLDNQEVLLDQRAEEIIYPASLTKMMTVLVAIEHLEDLQAPITMTADIIESMILQDASVAGFSANETAPAIDYLYGIMLASGGDAASALSQAIAGSEENFVALMNKKAQELGMDQTHFVNTTGLHDDYHYTSLHDLAILVKYALTNQTFYTIFTRPTYVTQMTPYHPQGLIIESTLFKKLGGRQPLGATIIGGKTGYTLEAGLNLASIAQIGDQTFLLITAAAPGDATSEQYNITDALNIYSALAMDISQ